MRDKLVVSDQSSLSFVREAKATLILALPLMAGQVGQMLMSLADTVMVGKVGVVPLAAATFANTLLIVPFLFGVGLLIAISVRVSQGRGGQRDDDVRGALRHGTWLAVILGLAVVLLMLLLLPFLGEFGQPDPVVDAMPGYLMFCAASMVPAYITMAWKNFGDALNKPWTPFWILMAGVLVNVLLNWIFIYGNCGFSALGLDGAGLATLLSRCITALALYFWLVHAPYTKVWTPVKLMAWWGNWDKKEFKKLMALGVPIGFQLVSEITAFSIGAVMIGIFGVVPLAAHQVALVCAYIAAMVPVGIAMALVVRMGEATESSVLGLKRVILLGAWLFSFLFTTGSMLLFIFCGYWISRSIVADPDVIELAVKLLVIVGVFQIVDGMQIVSFSALRGMGDVKTPAFLAALCYLGIAVPLSWVFAFPLHMGAEGVWWGLAIGLAIAAVVLGWRSWRLAA
ncbi:MAG: MATE family efflux transporter [Akkermansiaceae bacterium]